MENTDALMQYADELGIPKGGDDTGGDDTGDDDNGTEDDDTTDFRPTDFRPTDFPTNSPPTDDDTGGDGDGGDTTEDYNWEEVRDILEPPPTNRGMVRLWITTRRFDRIHTWLNAQGPISPAGRRKVVFKAMYETPSRTLRGVHIDDIMSLLADLLDVHDSSVLHGVVGVVMEHLATCSWDVKCPMCPPAPQPSCFINMIYLIRTHPALTGYVLSDTVELYHDEDWVVRGISPNVHQAPESSYRLRVIRRPCGQPQLNMPSLRWALFSGSTSGDPFIDHWPKLTNDAMIDRQHFYFSDIQYMTDDTLPNYTERLNESSRSFTSENHRFVIMYEVNVKRGGDWGEIDPWVIYYKTTMCGSGQPHPIPMFSDDGVNDFDDSFTEDTLPRIARALAPAGFAASTPHNFKVGWYRYPGGNSTYVVVGTSAMLIVRKD